MYTRIGHIDFLNILPLTHGLSKDLPSHIHIIKGVPYEVNCGLLNGKLDVSGISSIIYAKWARDLILVPNLSVRTDAEVTSILLFSKVPASELDGKRILLTAKSQTSHALLEIILRESYGVEPKTKIVTLDVKDPIPDDAMASLFIGDDALYLHNHPPKDRFIYDLGKEWNKLTGLGMVYSVWAMRRSFATEDPKTAHDVASFLIERMQAGRRELSCAIQSILLKKAFSYQEIERYFDFIQHDLRDEHLEGLELFYQKAKEHGILEEVPELIFLK